MTCDAIKKASTAHYPAEDIRTEVQRRLENAAQEHDVEILFACESGSRGWGFASDDSDYDVRFVYVHKPSWYLSLDPRRDVIEYAIVDEIDLGGWELRKALGLMRKSNGALLEWLDSPISYMRNEAAYKKLNTLATECFQPVAGYYHYHALAKGKFRQENPTLKSLCYALRTLLAAEWIIDHGTRPPMRFVELVDRQVTDTDERRLIADLIDMKGRVTEKDTGDIDPDLMAHVERRRVHVENNVPAGSPKVPGRPFDALLRETLEQTWRVDFDVVSA